MTGYTPADFAAQLGGAVLVILPWVGVAVAAGLLLFFAFLGIRAGIGFFLGTAGGYDKDGNWSGPVDHDDDEATRIMVDFYDNKRYDS